MSIVVGWQSSGQAEPPQVKNSQAGVPLFARRQKGDGLLGMDYPEKGPAALAAAASSKRIKENAFRGACLLCKERRTSEGK